MKPIRIVVVDDSLTIRAMIETLLERDSRVQVVGIARDGEEAIAMIRAERPDVVTLDIAMPGKDGMMILDEIMDMDPCPVIMLSSLMRDGAPIVADALDRDRDLVVLDARRTDERSSGGVRGSMHIPVHELADRIDEVPDGEERAHGEEVAVGLVLELPGEPLGIPQRRGPRQEHQWVHGEVELGVPDDLAG